MRTPIRCLSLAITAVLLASCHDAPSGIAGSELSTPATSQKVFTAVSTVNSQLVGGFLFNDVNLSVSRNQSCATCHEPSEGFAGAVTGVPEHGSNIQGSVTGKFGNRKPPTAAYATFTPTFTNRNGASGGLFWDGRATGSVLGTPAADQALGPFLNPVEQALPDAACLVYRVRNAREHYIIPIDEFFKLTGIVRLNWKGLSGGTDVWQKIQAFLETLRRRT